VSWWLVDIGIDGFRLDVPDEVPYWFWELFRKQVKAIKPDAWLVGEIWHNAQGWVDRRYFDSVMNYAYFKNPLLDYFILKISAMSEFKTRIEEGLARYPFHACAAMMNLLGSHDTWRIASLAKDNSRVSSWPSCFKCALWALLTSITVMKSSWRVAAIRITADLSIGTGNQTPGQWSIAI
jgi:glycosidase